MSMKDKIAEKEREFKDKFGGGFWNPTDGEILEGIVKELGTEVTKFRKDQPYLLVSVEGKDVKVFCNSQLEALCTEENVEVGNMVAIKYLGSRVSSKTGKTYKNFVLVNGGTVKEDSKEEETPIKKKKSIF